MRLLVVLVVLVGCRTEENVDYAPTSWSIPQTSTEDVSVAQQKDREALYQLADAAFNARNFTLAAEYYKQSAALGDASAQFQIALLHSHGLGVPRSEAHTVLYLTFSALSGNLNAQLAMSNRHLWGYGVSKGCHDAVKHLRKVANVVARTYKDAGVLSHIEKVRLNDKAALQQRQTDEDIMHYYQYSADKGDAQSQMILGRAYMFGTRGLEQNAQLAEQYFTKAVANGEAAGYGGLGQLYAQGVDGGEKPLERNYTKAREFFSKGSALGHPVSWNGMGFLFMAGLGVDVNYTEAAHYFQKAANVSNPEAQYNLGVLYLNGEGVKKDALRALQFLQAASHQGQILAHYQLGNMYMDGIGVAPNCMMAVKYYRAVTERGTWMRRIEHAYEAYVNGDYTTALLHYLTVAEQGYEIGNNNAAFMLDQELGLDEIPAEMLFPLDGTEPPKERRLKDIYKERALALYRRSAEQNNVDALLKLGDYYYYGWGGGVSLAKAVEKYREAADRGHPQALFNLGYMYENGLSVHRDFHLAKRYYDQSLAQSEQAWAPITIALYKLSVRRWLEELMSPSKIPQQPSQPTSSNWANVSVPQSVGGYPLENIVLTGLVGLLLLLLFLRHNARPAV